MHSILIAGLFSFFQPEPPKPVLQTPEWKEVKSAPLQVKKAGTFDYAGKIHVLGKIPPVVKEYGTPALHVFVSDVTVKNFAWRGSMESLHVGSRPFTGPEMRKRHQPIQVTLDNLFCDDIGEDAIGIQPRAIVTLKNSQFRGNFGIKKGEGENPGLDKIVQIDGATVTIENCTFFNGLSPIRAKANSVVHIKNCKFVNCSTCVSGDGLDTPRGRKPYDNGKAGPCKIFVENCECWDCAEFARAFEGCVIELKNVKMHDTWRLKRLSGGKVIVK